MSIQKHTNGNGRPWYAKTIMSYARANEIKVVTATLALVFCSIISAQIFALHHTFTWIPIEPLSPLPWIRVLFSAITFVTIGALLYFLRFYQFLSFIFHTILHDHEGYVMAKAVIWFGLNYFIYYYVQPIVIKFLNQIISFVYNVITFFLFLSPALGITILCLVVYALIRKFLHTHQKRAG